MLPRLLVSILVSGALCVGAAVPATAATRDWEPSSWTGVALGAPVPAAGLTAPMPAPLPPTAYLPIAYEGQTGCDSTPKPGALYFAALIRATYGSEQSIGIPRGCEVGGRSEHKEGRAVDWMIDVRDPAERAKAEAFLNWLLGPDQAGRPHGHAMQLGVMYIGWHDRMWRGYRPEVGWTELKSCFSTPDPKYDNHCHRNHIHISLTWAGSASATAPAPGAPVAPARPAAPAQPGLDNDDFMSVGSELGFMTEEGDPLEPGELRTVDLAPVASNAGTALVLVTSQSTESDGRLRIGMVEAKASVGVDMGKRRMRTSVVEVPVANGQVQIAAPKSGAVDVRVDVLGYTIAGGRHRAIAITPVTLAKGRFRPGRVLDLRVRGEGDVPRKRSRATAVLLRVTSEGRGQAGRFVAYPTKGAELGTSAARVLESGVATSVIAADIGADGKVALATSVPTKARVEIIGYVAG